MLRSVISCRVVSCHVIMEISQTSIGSWWSWWYMVHHQLPPVVIPRFYIVRVSSMRGWISFETNWDVANYMPVQNLSAMSALITFNQSVPWWLRNTSQEICTSFSFCCVLLYQINERFNGTRTNRNIWMLYGKNVILRKISGEIIYTIIFIRSVLLEAGIKGRDK